MNLVEKVELSIHQGEDRRQGDGAGEVEGDGKGTVVRVRTSKLKYPAELLKLKDKTSHKCRERW